MRCQNLQDASRGIDAACRRCTRLGYEACTSRAGSRAVSAWHRSACSTCAGTRTVHARRGALRVLLLVHVGAEREDRQAVRLRQVRRLPRAEALRGLQPIHARHLHARQGRIRGALLDV
jgi:hypothetical protein